MDIVALWGRTTGWLLSLHRTIYLDLAEQMRALVEGSSVLMAAMFTAFLLGLVHALTPGHGRSVVVAYFLGRESRPWAGVAMGLRIAAVHVALGAVLFVLLQGAVLASGLTGAAASRALRLVSHAAVALVGLWLLARAIRAAQPEQTFRPGLLATAVGLVPCPMTLLLLGYAAANASLAVGLMLAGAMAFGIAATLGAIGLIAIVSRRRLSGWLGGDSRFEVAVRPLAAVSAAIIACVGTGAFLVELWSRRGPFG